MFYSQMQIIFGLKKINTNDQVASLAGEKIVLCGS